MTGGSPREILVDKLMRKALLPAAESDLLDYTDDQKKHLVFARGKNTLRGFELSCRNQRAHEPGLTLLLDHGVVYGVDILTEGQEKVMDAIIQLCSKMFLGEHFHLLPGDAYKLDVQGTKSLRVDISFHLIWPVEFSLEGVPLNMHLIQQHDEPKPLKGQGSNSGDHAWPLGMILLGVARTLPELLDTAQHLLQSVAGIGIVVGVKQYEMTAEQLVAFCCYKNHDGSISGEAFSFGDKPLEETTLRVLEEHRMSIKGLGYEGAGVCDQPGMESYKMMWPGEAILHRTTDRPDKSVADTVLDLFYIRATLRGDEVELPPSQWHPKMLTVYRPTPEEIELQNQEYERESKQMKEKYERELQAGTARLRKRVKRVKT